METEIRYYFSLNSENNILNYLKQYNDLEYLGKFYERTDQYNHPMKKFDFYGSKIDGRFRVRVTKSDLVNKCMITWKRRLKGKKKDLIHQEEEVELQIKPEEYDNLCFLLINVLHLELKESYERYRNVFRNQDVEIVVDHYPFGIALEIEAKNNNKDPYIIINNWVDKLKLKLDDAYKLSWDDKYSELCHEQNKEVYNIVTFEKDMPIINNKFNL